MPRMRVAIDYHHCQPEDCKDGICQAALACEHRVLTQNDPFKLPDSRAAACLGCGVCISSCPHAAVRLM